MLLQPANTTFHGTSIHLVIIIIHCCTCVHFVMLFIYHLPYKQLIKCHSNEWYPLNWLAGRFYIKFDSIWLLNSSKRVENQINTNPEENLPKIADDKAPKASNYLSKYYQFSHILRQFTPSFLVILVILLFIGERIYRSFVPTRSSEYCQLGPRLPVWNYLMVGHVSS